MKTLIAYATKSGTTEKCAKMLAERLPEPTLVDLAKDKPDPSEYDIVVVGGSIRMGGLRSDAIGYLTGAKPALLNKKLGIFICCTNEDGMEKIVEANIDPELRAHATCITCFGGELDIAKLRGFEKLAMKIAMKGNKEIASAKFGLHEERISEFAKELLR